MWPLQDQCRRGHTSAGDACGYFVGSTSNLTFAKGGVRVDRGAPQFDLVSYTLVGVQRKERTGDPHRSPQQGTTMRWRPSTSSCYPSPMCGRVRLPKNYSELKIDLKHHEIVLHTYSP